jgi:hypothetical protein
MKNPKRNEHLRSDSNRNRFLALLNQNRINDLQRKQFLEPKSRHSRTTKSMSTNNLPSQCIVAINDNLNNDDELVSRAFHRSEYQEIQEAFDLNNCRTEFRQSTKTLKEKISENLVKSKTNILVLNQAKVRDRASLKKVPSFYLLTDADPKNFCDFYAFTQTEWNDGQNKEGRVRQTYNSRSRNTNLFGHRRPSQLSPSKTRNYDLSKKQSTSTDANKKRLSYRIKSVLSKKSFIPNLQQGSDIKLNMRDSSFLSKYFKLKNDLLENQEESLSTKQKLVEEMSQFIKQNYKSYWMNSIEDLLSQNAIEHIRFGYYRYKSINFGPFKLMTDVEKMIFRVQEDISKERMILQAGERFRAGEV